MTWKKEFLLNLMSSANASKCACKVCWTLRMKYLELAKEKVETLERSLSHFKKMGRFVPKKSTHERTRVAPKNDPSARPVLP